jgi:hypothetical protein
MPLPPDTLLFNQTVGRVKPRMPHPTARTFDRTKWDTLKQGGIALAEDNNLCDAAIFYGEELGIIRQQLETSIFSRLTADQITLLAVAIANEQHLKLDTKKEDFSKNKDSDAPAISFDLLRNRTVYGPTADNRATVGAASDTLVDLLPHWIDRARISQTIDYDPNIDIKNKAIEGSLYLSFEHAVRDLWQQVLWEKSILDTTKLTQSPADNRLAKLWQIWIWRNETLHSQNFMIDLSQHRPNMRAQIKQEPYLKRTVVQIRGKSRATRKFKYSDQSAYASSQTLHRIEKTIIEDSYLEKFLESELTEFPTPKMTLARLQKAWSVVRDAAKVLTRKIRSTQFKMDNLDSLALRINGAELKDAIVQCAEFSAHEAEAAIELFSAPITDMQLLFRKGFWGCPLVRLNDTEIAIVLAPLEVGSPPRRLEIWLDRMGMRDKIEKYGAGHPYEEHVRSEVCKAISKNTAFKNSKGYKSALLAKSVNGEEQVDLIFKLRNLVVVGEIKCLLTPAEASERYDYLRKLEGAAEQAVRKTKFLESNSDDALAALNVDKTELPKLKFVSIVVTNQGFGLGFDAGCAVVDLHFLRLFLQARDYISSSAMVPSSGQLVTSSTTLYSSESDAEDKFESTMKLPPTIARTEGAFSLVENRLPLSGRRQLTVKYFSMTKSPTPKDERDWLNAVLKGNS